MPIILDTPQRSSEWFKARLGLPTGSCFEKIVTKAGMPSKSAPEYLLKLATEARTGKPTENYVSLSMKKNAEKEPEARDLYSMIEDVEVREVGFVYKDNQKKYGVSPDGLVGDDGGLEIKGAEPHVQARRLLYGWPEHEHYQQVQGNLFVCERKWWDLMSYSSKDMPSLIIRFERDEAFIDKLRKELDSFCTELAITINKLKNM